MKWLFKNVLLFLSFSLFFTYCILSESLKPLMEEIRRWGCTFGIICLLFSLFFILISLCPPLFSSLPLSFSMSAVFQALHNYTFHTLLHHVSKRTCPYGEYSKHTVTHRSFSPLPKVQRWLDQQNKWVDGEASLERHPSEKWLAALSMSESAVMCWYSEGKRRCVWEREREWGCESVCYCSKVWM